MAPSPGQIWCCRRLVVAAVRQNNDVQNLPDLDEKFLDACGLAELDAETKRSLLTWARNSLEHAVGTRLSSGLSNEQLEEFESFIDHDAERVDQWIADNSPFFEGDPIYRKLRAGAPASIPDEIVRAEYAALAWLKLHRPDYHDVVEEELEYIRAELTERAREILAGTK